VSAEADCNASSPARRARCSRKQPDLGAVGHRRVVLLLDELGEGEGGLQQRAGPSTKMSGTLAKRTCTRERLNSRRFSGHGRARSACPTRRWRRCRPAPPRPRSARVPRPPHQLGGRPRGFRPSDGRACARRATAGAAASRAPTAPPFAAACGCARRWTRAPCRRRRWRVALRVRRGLLRCVGRRERQRWRSAACGDGMAARPR
jgi:hypothetical protein